MPVERDEPTQRTPEGPDREAVGLPPEGGGTEIPVPKREDWDKFLGKAIKPSLDSTDEDDKPDE